MIELVFFRGELIVTKLITKKLIWNDKKYSVGISRFDEQHKVMLGLINDLCCTPSQSEFNKMFKDTISQSIHYFKYHLDDEELYLRGISFPELESHLKSHRNFVLEISRYYTQSTKHVYPNRTEFTLFLQNWFENHICVEDMKYKAGVLQ